MTNAQRIVQEFNDLYAVMELLQEDGHIRTILDRKLIDAKKKRFEKFLQHSREMGTLGV